MTMRIQLSICVALLALGCGKKPDVQPPEPPAAPAPAEPVAPPPSAPSVEAPAQPTPAPSAAGPTAAVQGGAEAKAAVEVHITASASGMVFDVTKISAAAGQKVHVMLENKAPGVLPHNWALLKPGTEAAVALAGLKMGLAAGYLQEGPDVLAHTPMVQPGTTGEVTFNAPTVPGKYPYICTFPGHYMMMKGVLEVTP